MTKIKKTISKYMNRANLLASFALFFSVMAANTRCMCYFPQPEKPDELNSLRKY